MSSFDISQQPGTSDVFVLPPIAIESNRRREFIEFSSTDPRAIQTIEVESTENPPEIPFQTYAFKRDRRGSLAHQNGIFYSLSFRPQQDVLDLIIFSRDENGEISIYALEKERPALAARDKLGLPQLESKGLQLNLPGRYFEEDGTAGGVDGSTDQYLNKYGLLRKSGVAFLGPAYFVDPHSPELASPRIVEVYPKDVPDSGLVLFGEKFEGQAILKKLSPQDIFDGFQKGIITDLRLVQAVHRFYEQERGQKTDETLRLNQNNSLRRSLPIAAADIAATTAAFAIPILDKTSFRRQLRAIQTNIHSIRSVGPTVLSPDVSVKRWIAINKRNAEQTDFNDTYEFDLSVATRPDSIHPIPYFQAGETIYVLINFGERVAAVLRNQVAHRIYSNYGAGRFEGIYMRPQPGLPAEKLEGLIRLSLKEDLGITLDIDSKPEYLGRGTFSPGFDPGVATYYCTKIDPTKFENKESNANIVAVSLEDLGDLIDSGDVYSLELIVAYVLLSKKFDIHRKIVDKGEGSAEIYNELTQIFNGSSQTRRILAGQHPAVYSALLSSKEGQNVIAYLLNEGRGITYTHSKYKKEKGLFDGGMPLSPIGAKENIQERILGFHDCMHAILRDPQVFQLPISVMVANKDVTFSELIQSQECIQLSEEKYTDALLERESDALWFSEVYVPSIYGFENYRSDLGKTSLGEVFIECGFDTLPKQRAAIRSMVMDGIISPELIKSPRYNDIQWCVQEKLLGYFIRDKKKNCRLLYNARVREPVKSKIISLFYPLSSVTLEQVLQYSHAVNNLKEYTVTLRSTESTKSISQLAALAQKLSANPNPGPSDIALLDETWNTIKKLWEAHQELARISGQIHSSELSEENLALYARIKEIAAEDGPIKRAQLFCQKHWRGKREYPSAVIHPFFTTEQQNVRIRKLESRQLDAYFKT